MTTSDAGRQVGGGRRVLVCIGDLVDERYPVEVSFVDDTAEAVGTPQTGFRRAELPVLPAVSVDGVTKPELENAGSALFDLLAISGLDEVWAAVGPAPLLLDVRPEELRGLPWELLRDRSGAYPFTDRAAPAVRARLPFPLRLPDVSVPIHVLVVVGDPEDKDVLRPDDEIEAIYEGLRGSPCCWQVDVMRGPQMAQLHQDYPDIAPHVLHVIGHGMKDADSPAVEIRPPDGLPWPLTADFLTGALPHSLRPRLVVLNACRTAAEPDTAAQLSRGLTEALLNGGTAAVVSMQGDVASAPAVRFTEALYSRLAALRPVDAAVAEARAAIRFTGSFRPRDWVLPVLELRAEPASVLRQPRRLDPAAVIRQHNGFRQVSRLVDRTPQRRQMQRRISATHGRESGADGLLFVTGAREIGKSLLIRSCIVTQAVRGDAVIYYSLEDRGHVSAADFVLGVAEAAQRWLGGAAARLCQDALAALHRVLEQPAEAARPYPGQPVLPPLLPLLTPARPNQSYTPIDDAYKKLQGLLVTLARTEPLVLVLDHVGRIDERDAFVRGLLLPAADERELPGIQVVVVDRSAELAGIAGAHAETLLTPDRQIPVPAFSREDARTLAREYLVWSRPDQVDRPTWTAVQDKMTDWAEKRAKDEEHNHKDLGPKELLLAATLYLAGAGLEPEPGIP